jgi:signal transduction histidine kinase/ligand-binding sensor domain-containing protein/DNA-binding response OmpR family regulator
MKALSSINKFRTFALFAALLICHLSATSQYFFKNINSDSGLSSNSINTIFRDSQGYLWVGTNFGLNRYDGYAMKVYKHDFTKENSLVNNYIFSIEQDADGVLWIQSKSGMSSYNYETETFENSVKNILLSRSIIDDYLDNVICSPKNTAHIVNDYNVVIYNHQKKKTVRVEKQNEHVSYQNGCFDAQENLWLTDSKQSIYKVNASTGKIIFNYSNLIKKEKNQNNSSIFVDKRNKLWIIINFQRLYFFDPVTSKIIDFKQDVKNASFNKYPIRSIVEDDYSRMWIATDHGGIALLNPFTFETSVITENEKQVFSLSENSITALFADKDGAVWVGTYKQGVDYFHPLNRRFITNKIPGASSNNDINCFTEDKDGNVFIGTNGKGLFKYNPKKNTYTTVNYSGNPNKDNTVVSLLYDSKARLWIGTYIDGLYCYTGNKFIHYSSKATTPPILPDENIWSLLEDASQNIWIGTLNNGLFRFDEKNKTFVLSTNTSKKSLCIECAFMDKDKNMLFGTTWGIDMYQPNGKLKKQIEFKKNNDGYAERNYINSIAQDKKGNFWVATQSGLAVLNAETGDYVFITNDAAFDNEFISMVLVDASNNIWISTASGIYRLNVNNYDDFKNISANVVHFGKDDGLQDNKFNGKSAFLTKNNKLYFGGMNGFNIIDPQKLTLNKHTPNLVFTNLYINSNLINIDEEINGRVLLKKSLNFSSGISLKHNENKVSIGFSALSFLHPEKNKYEYQLEGFEEKWNTVDALNPVATYNNLGRGNYVFKVRLKENGQFANTETILLKIEMKPPFWLSWPAFLLYLVVAIALAVFIYRFLVDRATFELQLNHELQERKHVEEISAMKVKFFTNLSHELRTPVSLIMLPVENMLIKNLDPTLKNNLTMVLRNAKRLLFIVNQLLDFRKLEVGEITYHPVMGNIVSFIKDVTLPFMDIAQNKNIKLTVRSNVEELYTNFDHNKLERILFNLLSNAFKFTPNRGAIEVVVHYHESNPLPILIEVSDTGIGIDSSKISNIFKPFYQIDNQGAIADMGTGIGLSITYEFVRLHGGNIRVESVVDKGTSFIIELPMTEERAPVVKEELPEEELIISNENLKIPTLDSISKKSRSILVVDDNDDFRFYMVENLRGLYNVIEANNGKIAYEKANQFLPDIIVSDVTMPEMDGIELCKQLKSEVNTSHIPIVLLTANTLSEDKIAGFEAGADEYISKPFNVGVLKARIRNLLIKKDEQRSKLNAQSGIEISEVKLPTLDEKLLEKVNKYTLENITDTEYSIEELSKKIGMSTVYLNKKISALTGKTTSEYVRSIRLRKAAQLLEKSDLSISEVAYEVGYNSPKYFSKYFKDEYGILPSEYRKNYM